MPKNDAMPGALVETQVVVALGGGIAAYKGVEVVRELQRAGARVRAAMTPAATHFVGTLTLEALTRHPVMTDVLSLAEDRSIDHVEWGHACQLLVVAPATADLLAKLAAGMAHDAVTALALSTTAPVLVCPAMEPNMWAHPATQHNVKTLVGRGVRLVAPQLGALASGRHGVGRLAEVADIVAAARGCLQPQDLTDRHVVVTAGPTREHLDPVRFLSNPSTGRMGVALAQAAGARGARVTLVHGPLAVATPPGVNAVGVTTALQMLDALNTAMKDADVLLMSAAVSDWRAAEVAQHKVKKGAAQQNLTLVANPDLLVETQGVRPGCIRVGFAAETQDVVAHAKEKLVRKGLHMVVANDVSQPDAGFAAANNRVVLVTASGHTALPLMDKLDVAHAVLGQVVALLRPPA